MTWTTSITILLLLFVACSIEAGSKQRREIFEHEGKCPSHHFPIHIHCRRRVCRPQDLIPLCKSDGDCPTTQKCCRPLCSCRDRCVEVIHE
ncbi:unnamed protein product [Rotaria sp. Silwood2]|nr:unnamed protein product [Rotaria sp. Silwood2]CAF2842534.1 unnamed protein product [Rotaria sp. Silwood2]CAF3184443.1 unnamed protein product [Rotaria sp. Silwood2]CAF3241627.1 unnamed protein product [Rotaria sp. Silwood2]CAF4198687.1 unnamed protein product [Rotaria sp. Silwood2]